MNQKEFDKQKAALLNIINAKLSEQAISSQDVVELEHLFKIVDGYHFQNRQFKKGLLSHTIVDSIQLDYSVFKTLYLFRQGN